MGSCNLTGLVFIGRCLCILLLVLSVGCQNDPPLFPVSGRVTLGGKSYERLIVYFRPIGREVNKFNLGVGETDANGILRLRSTAGAGLAAGKYRVSFSCMAVKGGQVVDALSEKVDDNRTLEIKELVPSPYCEDDNSPQMFEVTAGGENRYDFDIPP